jgi:hypothetical protein
MLVDVLDLMYVPTSYTQNIHEALSFLGPAVSAMLR